MPLTTSKVYSKELGGWGKGLTLRPNMGTGVGGGGIAPTKVYMKELGK
jgi:hypothetical protein